jgi:hypothetical protein
MDNEIYAYILARTLFEKGRDPIDCCSPFVLYSFPRNREASAFKDIQQIVSNKIGTSLPTTTLNNILSIYQKSDFIESYDKNNYRLTEKGVDYLDKHEKEETVKRRLDILYSDIETYFFSNGETISREEINNFVNDFTKRNILSLLCFFFGGDENLRQQCSVIPITTKLTVKEKILVKYIGEAQDLKRDNYETLRDIVLGSIITLAGCLNYYFSHKISLSKCIIYLDTNFVFSILELHFREFYQPAKELFDLLKKYNFKIKIFDFTLDEVCRVLRAYPEKLNLYPDSPKVNSIHSNLKKIGWTKQEVFEYIGSLERKLNSMGIDIEWTKINLESYEPINKDIRGFLLKHKKMQPHISQNHDIAAIEKIQEIRAKRSHSFQNLKALFLSSDGYLCNANFYEMGHSKNGTICEVILDRLLTNILWLMNPQVNISLESIIAVCSRDLFVLPRIWERFYNLLIKVRENDSVPVEDLAILFWHNRIEEELSNLDENEIDLINEDFLIQEIDKAKISIQEQTERELSEKTSALQACITQKEEEIQALVELKKQEAERVKREKNEEIKKILLNMIEQSANRRADILVSLLSITLIVLMFKLFLILKAMGLHEFLFVLIPLIFSGLGLYGFCKIAKLYFKRKIYDQLLNMKKKELFHIGISAYSDQENSTGDL